MPLRYHHDIVVLEYGKRGKTGIRAAGEADLNDPRLYPCGNFRIGAFVERHRNSGMGGTKLTKPAGQKAYRCTLDNADAQAAPQHRRVAGAAGEALDRR